MAITRQSDRRKSNRRESNRRKDDRKIIKIEEEGGKQQEMTVRQAVPKKKAKSVWSGHEEFTREWSETFITKKRKKHPRKGE